MNPAEDLPLRLAQQLAGVATEADLDLALIIGDAAPVTVRFDASGASIIPTGDPARTVTLHVSPDGAAQVIAGTANAQMLLASGDLKIGGRIDVLQANAAALSALGGPDAAGGPGRA